MRLAQTQVCPALRYFDAMGPFHRHSVSWRLRRQRESRRVVASSGAEFGDAAGWVVGDAGEHVGAD